MWQPKLNHPYIVSFLKRGALGCRPNKRIRNTVSSKFGLRLLRNLRKKLHKQLQPEPIQLKHRSAWEILFNRTCFSRAPFEEAKRLRSDRYLPDEIYSLIRLSNCLEERERAKPVSSSNLFACTEICRGPDQIWDFNFDLLPIPVSARMCLLGSGNRS